jgi:hypothetical protein
MVVTGSVTVVGDRSGPVTTGTTRLIRCEHF